MECIALLLELLLESWLLTVFPVPETEILVAPLVAKIWTSSLMTSVLHWRPLKALNNRRLQSAVITIQIIIQTTQIQTVSTPWLRCDLTSFFLYIQKRKQNSAWYFYICYKTQPPTNKSLDLIWSTLKVWCVMILCELLRCVFNVLNDSRTIVSPMFLNFFG